MGKTTKNTESSKASTRQLAKSAKSKIDPNAVALLLELEVVRLIDVAARQNLTRQELPTRLANHVNVMAAIDPNNDEKVAAAFQCELRASYNDEEPAKNPLEEPLYIRALIQAVYTRRSPKVPIAHEQLVAFANTIGFTQIWPYWREFVQSMTSRMGQPTLTLPMVQNAYGSAPKILHGPIE